MPRPHRPGPGRVVPTATYRLQIHSDFGYAAAADVVPYLAALGVSHLYLSPVLEPAPGSRHGYDVLDHTRVHSEAGGQAAYDQLSATCREHGMGIIVDVVPNHMAVPRPTHLNAPLWSVLRDGRESPYAAWFDVDWAVEDDRLLMPVLGGTVEEALSAGDLVLAQDGGPTGREWVLWHHGDEFPVREGTETLPLRELVEAQAYRLSSWREAGESLNYRRFFDVTSLVAIRVEDPVVFAATHATLLGLLGRGDLDGFRIDHPDGLADPEQYLDRLADASGDAWVVVEKILEGEEQLPTGWRCAGTTGYDSLLRIQQVLTWDGGIEALDEEWASVSPERASLAEVVTESKRLVVADVQSVEVDRLMRLVARVLPGEDSAALRRGLEALLVGMGRYRAYLRPGEVGEPQEYAVLDAAEARALDPVTPADREAVAVIAQLARGGALPQSVIAGKEAADEFRVRFQQTCGPVMAKGIEDTAFYRWLRLTGANEVGGHPDRLTLEPADFHAWCARQQEQWPLSMTALTTHDTKRSEDVRARLATLAEDPHGWRSWVASARELGARHRGERIDPETDYLIWQTLVGAWPIDAARLTDYLLKAVREAKVHTAWVDGDADYEEAVTAYAAAVVADPVVQAHVGSWLAGHQRSYRAVMLGQKALQLTMPGVPDVYQGTELEALALVDPDNRRPVDYARRRARLAALTAGVAPLGLDDAKLDLVRTVLRIRREHPEWFVGEGAEYAAVGCGSPHALAVGRGCEGVLHMATVVTRGASVLDDSGGFGDARALLPEGSWRDMLRGESHLAGGDGVPLADLLAGGPVAVLVRESA